jgi:hypothetical protein
MPSLAEQIGELEAFPLERLPVEGQRLVREQLGRLKRLLAANPLQLAEPYPKQQRFLAATESLKGFFGGNGAGKSWIGTLDDCVQLVDRDVVPKHLQGFKHWEPPFFLRVVVPKQKILDTKTIPEFRAMLPADQLRGGSFDKAYRGSEGKLYLENGSWVLFNTSDQDRDAHAAVELHRCRFDEEPEGEHGRGIYTENVARLRKFLPHAQISFTMTPLFGMSWTFDEVFERRDEPGVHVTVASMRDNPHVNSEATIAAMSHLSEAELRAVVDGEFVHFAGAVIDLKDAHVVPKPPRSHVRGLQVYVGIDPGIARGGVVWAGFDRDNRMLVFDELYPEGQTVEEIVADIRAKNAEWGLERPTYVIDPSARNRSLVNAQSVEAEFQKFGIFPLPGQNSREAGILQLRGRLEHGGLLVSENCKAVRYEAKRWLVAKDEKTSEESAAGDQFVTKGPDHTWDPIRYLAMERLWYQPLRQPKRQVLRPGFTPPPEFYRRPVEQREAGPMGPFS